MKYRKVLYVILAILWLVTKGGAVEPVNLRTDYTTDSLQITSVPSMARVCMKSEYAVFGQTPLNVSHLLAGTYRITVSKRGFESYHTTRTLCSGTSYQFSTSLKPRTTEKAALRSLLFPGWGQFYSEKKGRGFVFTGVEVCLLGGWLLTHLWHEAAWEDYVDYRERYNRAPFSVEKEIFYDEMRNRLNDAEDWDRWRDGFLWASAIFWAYNVLDAIIFFPRDTGWQRKEFTQSGGVNFSVSSRIVSPSVKLRIDF